ncbi:MAG: tripartite tricarboxylate transporter substrate-binding protein, partial [Deltaproteobacteria bacterium]|nr:tripartite tricarboxylate transporter substrate-binding protein [Deltaproteobacteria bacterium]
MLFTGDAQHVGAFAMKEPRIGITKGCVVLGLTLIILQPALRLMAAEPPFYSGKTLRVITGFAAGGTIDLRARLIARHLPQYIPGNPGVMVQSMVGAGGMVAANYALAIAKPDGLTLLHSPSGTVMNTLLTTTEVRYDIRKVPFLWLGSDSWLTVVGAKTTQINNAEDILKTTALLRVGGTGVTSVRSLRLKLALELLGVDHIWVTGYKGSSDLLLALEKGEIHLFEDPQDGYKSNIQPREKEGIAAVLWQTGILTPDERFKRSPHFPDMPTLDEILANNKKTGPRWEAWKAAVVPQSFQYLIAVAPGVPAEQVAILSRALQQMTHNSQFRAEFEKTLGGQPDVL